MARGKKGSGDGEGHHKDQQKLGDEFPDLITEEGRFYEFVQDRTYRRRVTVYSPDGTEEGAQERALLAFNGLAPAEANQAERDIAARTKPEWKQRGGLKTVCSPITEKVAREKVQEQRAEMGAGE
jgi:hypothetical protein